MILWSVELHLSRCYVSYRLESDLVPKLRVYLPVSECVTVRHWNMAVRGGNKCGHFTLLSLCLCLSVSLWVITVTWCEDLVAVWQWPGVAW